MNRDIIIDERIENINRIISDYKESGLLNKNDDDLIRSYFSSN